MRATKRDLKKVPARISVDPSLQESLNLRRHGALAWVEGFCARAQVVNTGGSRSLVSLAVTSHYTLYFRLGRALQ